MPVIRDLLANENHHVKWPDAGADEPEVPDRSDSLCLKTGGR